MAPANLFDNDTLTLLRNADVSYGKRVALSNRYVDTGLLNLCDAIGPKASKAIGKAIVNALLGNDGSMIIVSPSKQIGFTPEGLALTLSKLTVPVSVAVKVKNKAMRAFLVQNVNPNELMECDAATLAAYNEAYAVGKKALTEMRAVVSEARKANTPITRLDKLPDVSESAKPAKPAKPAKAIAAPAVVGETVEAPKA